VRRLKPSSSGGAVVGDAGRATARGTVSNDADGDEEGGGGGGDARTTPADGA
jgi:hypothetical protein